MANRIADQEEARIHGTALAARKAIDAEDKRLHPSLTIGTPATTAKCAEDSRLAAGQR